MAIRAVVFDIGGVLEITEDIDLGTRWEKEFGLSTGTLDERMADVWNAGAIGTMTEKQVLAALADRLGVSAAQVDAMMADMWVQYLGVENTELVAFARELRPRYRTGIVSNSFVGAREREQEAYRFHELVDDIVYSHEVGMSKPDPRIYHLASGRLGVRPEEMVFVDDVEANIAAANELGIRGVLFQRNAQVIADIEALLT